MKRFLTILAGAAVAFTGAVVVSAPASADTTTVTPVNNSQMGCSPFVLDWTGFEDEDNRITLSIDDDVVLDETFGAEFHDEVEFDDAVARTWDVAIHDAEGNQIAEDSGLSWVCGEFTAVLPQLPADTCVASMSDVELPTTEGVTYTLDQEQGQVVAVADPGYAFPENTNDVVGPDAYWAGSFPGTEIRADLPVRDCDDLIDVVSVSAVCDAGVPYIEYAVEAPWADHLEIGFAPADTTAQTQEVFQGGGIRGHMPLEGRTAWATWIPQDDPAGGPDVEFLPPEEDSPWTERFADGVDVAFAGRSAGPYMASGTVYVDSALTNPCHGNSAGGTDTDDSTPSAPAEADGGEDGDDSVLAATGATVAGAAGFALLLVAGGLTLYFVRRRIAKS